MANNIKVLTQYLKESSFKIEDAPNVFLRKQGKPNIEISVDIAVAEISENKEAKVFENILKIKAEAKEENKTIFTCEISYAGIFSLANIQKDMIEQVLLIYCPNLLFPYLRQAMSNMISLGGFPLLLLEPIDFAALYAKRKKVGDKKSS
jgi:preprotein translocase subunit SecB